MDSDEERDFAKQGGEALDINDDLDSEEEEFDDGEEDNMQF